MRTRSERSEYEGVTTRVLDDRERSFPTAESRTPLVIEPASSSDPALRDFLATHSDRVITDLYGHGAVLLRGFEVGSARAFEEALSGLTWLRPMSGFFMSENGRDRMPRTESVFTTNTFFVSGGDFRFGGVHCENYYSPDVPRYLAFCCLQSSWLGGETALFHMANAYGELRDRLAGKLESEAFEASIMPLRLVADRYRLPQDEVASFLGRHGIELVEKDGEVFMLDRKPTVVRHPSTGGYSIQVHLSHELSGFDVSRYFRPHYVGLRWALHRLAWRHGRLLRLLTGLAHVPRAARHPRHFVRFSLAPASRRLLARWGRDRSKPVMPAREHRIGLALDGEDVELLAKTLWEHSSVFAWQRGDVLVLDNLQMHHAGMPGFGPRHLAVVMANPVRLAPRAGSGLLPVTDDDGQPSLHEQLVQLAGRGTR